MNNLEMYSIITCPKCGHVESEEIPRDYSKKFYACKSCSIVIVAKPRDCCVFCSYGSSPCLSAQKIRKHEDDLSGVITIKLTEKLLSPQAKYS